MGKGIEGWRGGRKEEDTEGGGGNGPLSRLGVSLFTFVFFLNINRTLSANASFLSIHRSIFHSILYYRST